ncbi:MAG: BCAM0308 family protein [Candidatus Methylomirabilales bacterium]
MKRRSHGRKDRLIKEKRHDVYQARRKGPEPAVCPECGAVFVGGRWLWSKAPKEASTAMCPACRRIADNYPAGYLEIRGSFFKEHRDEILALIRNVEALEKGEHPLERIVSVTDGEGGASVTTTGIHVARRIGEALARSYKGEFSFQYGEGQKTITLHWIR